MKQSLKRNRSEQPKISNPKMAAGGWIGLMILLFALSCSCFLVNCSPPVNGLLDGGMDEEVPDFFLDKSTPDQKLPEPTRRERVKPVNDFSFVEFWVIVPKGCGYMESETKLAKATVSVETLKDGRMKFSRKVFSQQFNLKIGETWDFEVFCDEKKVKLGEIEFMAQISPNYSGGKTKGNPHNLEFWVKSLEWYRPKDQNHNLKNRESGSFYLQYLRHWGVRIKRLAY